LSEDLLDAGVDDIECGWTFDQWLSNSDAVDHANGVIGNETHKISHVLRNARSV
jgi:hypothetical protein